jgi:hypothetical protein
MDLAEQGQMTVHEHIQPQLDKALEGARSAFFLGHSPIAGRKDLAQAGPHQQAELVEEISR